MRLTQIKASSKGFTLVELIVVITILAILGTIAFISFGSQLSAARDSKRKTDLSSLASKINVALANGTTYLGLVWTQSNLVTNANIAWTWVISAAWTTQNYSAWLINFNVLGVNGTDFKDADNTNDYKIGATSNAGWAFQLAAKLENDSSWNQWANSLLVWNFNQRTTASSWTIISVSWNTAKLPNSLIWLFKKWDYVVIGTSTWSVTSVSSDLSTITTDITPTVANVVLAATESEWLVWNSSWSPIKNWDTTDFPY